MSAAVVLRWMGIDFDDAWLLDQVQTDDAGRCSMLALQSALGEKGLEVRAWTLTPDDVRSLRGPMILREERPTHDGRKEGHFIVLLSAVDERHVLCFDSDPLSGRRGVTTWDSALRYWTGETLHVARSSGVDDTGLASQVLKWAILPAMPVLGAGGIAVLRRRNVQGSR